MPEVICNTSPLQYLHQIGHLYVLPALAGRIIVPSAVEMEIEAGKKSGVSLPDLHSLDWVIVRRPRSQRTLTIGLLLDAKRAGLIGAVAPLLDQLQEHRFRLAAHTRRAVLRSAGEDF